MVSQPSANKRYTGLSLAALSKYLIQNNEFEDDVKAKGRILRLYQILNFREEKFKTFIQPLPLSDLRKDKGGN